MFPITLKSISFSYEQPGLPTNEVLRNVSINFICESQRVLISGPNGAGKSTLLDCIIGNKHASTGEVLLNDGRSYKLNQLPSLMTLGYVPQTPTEGIIPSLSIKDNLLLPTIARLKRRQEKYNEGDCFDRLVAWLKEVPHGNFLAQRLNNSPLELSGGQQQILCIATHLFTPPDLLILDEPTSKLAPTTKESIWDILTSPAAAGLTMIFASHDLEGALSVAHRHIILDAGQITSDDAPAKSTDGRRGELVNIPAQLPKRLHDMPDNWWKPGQLFCKIYETGDRATRAHGLETKIWREDRTVTEVGGVLSILKKFSIDPAQEQTLIVDCPCGFGRHSVQLAKRSHCHIYGLDINDEFLRQARIAGQGLEPQVTFLNVDMRNVIAPPLEPECCDVVMNLYTSFGFFKSEEENESVLKGFHDLLKPSGILILHWDWNPRSIVKGVANEPAFRHLPKQEGCLFVREIYCDQDKRMYGLWDVLSPNAALQSANYALRVYTESDFHRLSAKLGFAPPVFYGCLDQSLSTFNDLSEEFVVVLKKAPALSTDSKSPSLPI